eukprot:COSAG01_NODE_11658_length_1886_cov_2.736989_1_plen_137_part_00
MAALQQLPEEERQSLIYGLTRRWSELCKEYMHVSAPVGAPFWRHRPLSQGPAFVIIGGACRLRCGAAVAGPPVCALTFSRSCHFPCPQHTSARLDSRAMWRHAHDLEAQVRRAAIYSNQYYATVCAYMSGGAGRMS